LRHPAGKFHIRRSDEENARLIYAEHARRFERRNPGRLASLFDELPDELKAKALEEAKAERQFVADVDVKLRQLIHDP
jgi:hypothetical protein